MQVASELVRFPLQPTHIRQARHEKDDSAHAQPQPSQYPSTHCIACSRPVYQCRL